MTKTAAPIDSCPNCGHDLSMFHEPPMSRAEELATGIAERVASWLFAGTLISAVAAWTLINVIWQPFEPYPVIIFAVISAVLASLAALQGPLILLTQRRAAERDRQRDRGALMVASNSEADLHAVEKKLDRLIDEVARQPNAD